MELAARTGLDKEGQDTRGEADRKVELERGSWDSQLEFLLSCVGFTIGPSVIWRIPYMCYRYGGAAFLLAYTLMLILLGLPLVFLELTLGQYSGRGPLHLFSRMAPATKGLGLAIVFISIITVIYFNMISAYTLFYTFASFSSSVPPVLCGNTSVTGPSCYTPEQEEECFNLSNVTTFWNRTCTPVADLCALNLYDRQSDLKVGSRNTNGRLTCGEEQYWSSGVDVKSMYTRTSPAADYFRHSVLGLKEVTSWENLGGLRWQLVLCLAAAWIIVSLCLSKGVKSSGKGVYFTSLYPYLVLVILLILVAPLEGGYRGIGLFSPTWRRLLDVTLWNAAATQVFYSLGLGYGGFITLASYNKFTNNVLRDALIVVLVNLVTNILACVVVFSIFGFLAKQADVVVEEVIQSGLMFAFSTFPEAATKLPGPPQLWSFLFFTMLLCLVLNTVIPMTLTIITSVTDQFPTLRRHKSKSAVAVSTFCFFLGLVMCTNGGSFVFSLLDHLNSVYSIFMCAILMMITVFWVGRRKQHYVYDGLNGTRVFG